MFRCYSRRAYRLIAKGKRKGDILVVGLNSDSSIRRLKGNSRPINTLNQRIKVLSSIQYIDYIVVFDDETPLQLIEEIKPNVLVKGGDYKFKEIIGADFVTKMEDRFLASHLYITYHQQNNR